MKSSKENFRILSLDGKQYQFDYIAFSELLAEKASESETTVSAEPKNKTERIKRIPQSTWMAKIADELEISPEAVKNWKRGYNGPKDIDSVIKCAKVLDVDVLSLLRPLDIIQEYEKMNEKEIDVISDVFSKCIDAIYCYSDRWKQYTDDRRIHNRQINREAESIFKCSVEEIHRVVDKSALLITDSVRYRLHRILNDLFFISFCDPIPAGWEEIGESIKNNVDSFTLRFYYDCPTRESVSDNIWYFSDEQDIAEKMDYSYTPIPDCYYDNVNLDGNPLDGNDKPIPMGKFGITDDTEFEFSPNIIYKDMMTRALRDVFLHDFPGLKKGFGANGR